MFKLLGIGKEAEGRGAGGQRGKLFSLAL